MSFKYLIYHDEYISHKMDLLREFYLPVLKKTIQFDRAVGYFRADFLYEISKGISELIRNNGKMRIITSPDLTEEDINKIEDGYELRRLVEEKLREVIAPPVSFEEQERFNYVAHLIASNHLDIKIALFKDLRNNGIFHEKWGVFRDFDGNKISMVGSNNDTYSGLLRNHESFELNYSWMADTDKRKIKKKEKRFKQMWENIDDDLFVCDLPEGIKEEILKHKKAKVIPEEELVISTKKVIERRIKQLQQENIKKPEVINIPFVPNEISVRDYQWEAHDNWKNNGYHGIYSMATGTGKTISALNSLVQLYQETKKLFVIIVCPYQHLVEQWVEDLEKFNISPIIGHSKSRQKSWKTTLRNQVSLFNLKRNEKFCCFITTNATYSKEETREVLSNLNGEVLFIVDEAHNIGSESGIKGLLETYKYRLALSATFKRKYDEEGTNQIRDYFGDVVYHIGIKEAIFEKKCLVEYDYHPVLTFLTKEEFEKYRELTFKIAKGTSTDKSGKTFLNAAGKLAANERSLLIAKSSDKITKLNGFIPDIKNTSNNLIYCGAAKVNLEDMPEGIEAEHDEFRQVDLVVSMLVNNGIIATRFTANEDINQRQMIKNQFSNGTIGTVVAIKCLDEGVNIPSIERAFILASSKDEKQYIQRRGRVLRKFERWGYKKEKAVIYDFISLPFFVDYASGLTESDYKIGKTLVRDELDRIIDFYDTCSNKEEVEKIITELRETYGVEDEKK
ncbi:DEAD/DEAH box helicase family protein [Bacillus altitudinis]|uniref:DEAD/DEAH box helicase family protein n=1 Tax=Bacillus altitudinis TaxID=293387 RepID=UPI001F4E4B63|nr:DEAD/DEAH box helicase family protein [Bacillus altitudinis]MDC7797568.1 DEAD/DEAH box helicase family protein [Bacillus altitudinis]UNG01760.1 DEAD/DEAH box helicase family protein [Bacillus altitudinis]